MGSDALRIERRDAVTVLHVDDGKVNALTFDLIASIKAAVEAADADDAVGAVVIHGREGKFSAGFDLGGDDGRRHGGDRASRRRRRRSRPDALRLWRPGRRRVHRATRSPPAR